VIHDVWTAPAAVAAFVSDGLWGDQRGFGPCKAVGFVKDGALIAGVVFHNFDPWSGVIELSSYSTRRDWLTKARLRVIFGYPFDQVGLRMCVARISENNTRTLRIWRALGADLHRIPDLRAEGEAEVIATLKRDDWQSSKFAR